MALVTIQTGHVLVALTLRARPLIKYATTGDAYVLQQLRVIASVLSLPPQRPRLRLQLVASLGLGGLDKWLKSRGSLWPPPGRP